MITIINNDHMAIPTSLYAHMASYVGAIMTYTLINIWRRKGWESWLVEN